MARIQFVYFDLDDTLLDHRRAQNLALEDLYDSVRELRGHTIEEVKATYQEVNSRVWREYSEGTRDKEGTRTGRFRLLFEALRLEADANEAANLYVSAYEDHWEFIPGAWEAYKKIAAGVRTGVLTNGFAETQHKKLRRFPELSASFSSIVISEEEGVLKPALALFEAAAERAGVPAEAIAYVGDSLGSDILGGLSAGWQVYWFTEECQNAPANVPCFQDWATLPALLGQ